MMKIYFSGNYIFKLSVSLLAWGCFCFYSQRTLALQTTLGSPEALNILGETLGALYTGDHEITVANGQSVGNTLGLSFNSGGLTTQGLVTFLGNGTVTGSVGKAGSKNYINSFSLTGGLGFIVDAQDDIYSVTTNIDSGTLNAYGSIYGTDINFTNDGLLNLATNQNISITSINNTTSGQGIITLQGAHTINSHIGSTGQGLKLINVGYGTVNINGNINAICINYLGDNPLNIGDGYDLNTEIKTATNWTGTFTLLGDSTINGQIGTATNSLKIINTGANSKTNIFNNDIYANTINITGTGTVNLNGDTTATAISFQADGTINLAATQSLNAPITTTANGQGLLNILGTTSTNNTIGSDSNKLKTININAGTFTLNHSISANNININNATTAMQSDQSINGDLLVNTNSTLVLLNSTLSLDGDYTQASNSNLNISVNSSNDYGQLSISGSANINANSTLDITVNGFIPNGQNYNFISAGSGPITIPDTIQNNSFTTDFQLSVDGSSMSALAKRVNSYPKVASHINSARAGQALETLAATTKLPADLNAAIQLLESQTSLTQLQNKVDQLSSDLSNSISMITMTSAINSFEHISNHLNPLTVGVINPPLTGMSAGDPYDKYGMWIKAFYTNLEQATTNGIPGYTANTTGLVGVFDKYLTDTFLLGMELHYSTTDAKAKNTTSNSYITQLQAALYSRFEYTNNWIEFLDIIISTAKNEVKNKRNLPAFGVAAASKLNSYQYATKVEIGENNEYKHINFQPRVSLNYLYYTQPSYLETGAGALNLYFEDENYHLLQSQINIDISKEIQTNKALEFIPELHLGWLYDIIKSKQHSTATFSGSGPLIISKSHNHTKNGILVGLSLQAKWKEMITLLAEYDLEAKSNFRNQTAQLTARYEF